MPTTGQNFVRLLASALVGSAVQAAGKVLRMNPSNAAQVAAGGSGVILDKASVDFSSDGLAKHGAATVALTGTNPATIDLTNLATATASNDGDASFATFNQLVFTNLGAGSVTIAPGGSNPASIGLGGTTPTLTLAPGATHTLSYPAGVTVDSTHKTILLTPAADTVVGVAVAGA